MRSKLPPIICFICGMALLIKFFVPNSDIIQEWVGNSTQVVGVFGLAIGLASLIHMHGNRIKRMSKGWGFSIITLSCAVVVALIGLVPKNTETPYEISKFPVATEMVSNVPIVRVEYTVFGYQKETSTTNMLVNGQIREVSVHNIPLFDFVYNYIFFPLTATTFSLLAFYMITATYRAVRIKSWEAGILLFSTFVVLIGQVPFEDIPFVGRLVTDNTRGIVFLGFSVTFILMGLRAFFSRHYMALGVFVFLIVACVTGWILTPSDLTFEQLKVLILQYPNTAAKRGIIIGIALGGLATSAKIIFGIEKPYMGGKSN